MIKYLAIFALGLLLPGGLSDVASAQPQSPDALSAQFDKMLSAQFKNDEPGATALVARKGRVIYSRAFGLANVELDAPMRVDSVFKIGSITKQFTAVAILQLAEQRQLSLKDDITRFIPDYPTGGRKITIDHLLTHTSGIWDYSKMDDVAKRGAMDFTPGEMIDHFKNQPMRFDPGTKWEYSNSNYVLLGAIIEKITGKTYGAYLEQNIFKPAGMTRSLYANDIRVIRNRADGYSMSDEGIVNAAYLSMTQPYAAGSILSTVEDLFKWNQALQSGKLIKRETLKKAWTRYKLADGTETSYGYGWRMGYIQESRSLWHGGWINGFVTMALYLPDEDVFVTVLSNCDANSPEDVVARLAALAIGRPYEHTAILLAPEAAAGYEGVYENGTGQMRVITVAEDRVYFQFGYAPKIPMQLYQSDRFFFEDDAFLSAAFERTAGGEVDRLVTRSRERVDVWKKTGNPIPSPDGIKLDESALAPIIGEYEVNPELMFSVTREGGRLYIQATGQERLEMFAESETRFFLRVNDAQLEFVKDNSGAVRKAIISQGGRTTDAKKVR